MSDRWVELVRQRQAERKAAADRAWLADLQAVSGDGWIRWYERALADHAEEQKP